MLIGHGADRLGAERRDGVVHGALKPLQTVAFETDQCLGADDDIVEDNFRGAAAVDSGIAAAVKACLRFVDDEQAAAIAAPARSSTPVGAA
jgi:hypothetical protein